MLRRIPAWSGRVIEGDGIQPQFHPGIAFESLRGPVEAAVIPGSSDIGEHPHIDMVEVPGKIFLFHVIE